MSNTYDSGWHNPSANPHEVRGPLTYEQMSQRLHEMEALCRDIYVVAAELGLPQPLLTRLWVVAGHGTPPQAFAMDEQAATVQALHAPTPVSPEPARPPLPPLKRRRTVLVVDDDAIMLQVIERILRKENYELLQASSGAAALDLLNGGLSIDLLITDVAMPEMNGPQLAERVRELLPGLPVLFQTGFSDMLFDDRPDLGDHAAFLEKPFTARGLMEAARLVQFDTLTPRE
jgi:CheY-like chemotaxis protein